MTITNKQSKYIRSLATRKGRKEAGAFIAEGAKCIGDMLPHFRCQMLIGTATSLSTIPLQSVRELIELEEGFKFSKLSNLETPQNLLAVFEIPASNDSDLQLKGNTLLLDGVQDPGNMGSIIRTAHWFGMDEVWIGHGSADPYGPKVVQASMGSLGPVRAISIADTEAVLKELIATGKRVIGSFLNGNDLYDAKLPPSHEASLLVMGSEGRGISPALEQLITERITIAELPNQSGQQAESLNVSVATAIILSEWRRRQR